MNLKGGYKLGFKISLAAARVNAGMTQEQAAAAMKVSKTTINGWENGKTEPQYSAFKALCALYGIDEIYIRLPEKSN
jgi:transcriptional regulator with XRE-family HTH domain